MRSASLTAWDSSSCSALSFSSSDRATSISSAIFIRSGFRTASASSTVPIYNFSQGNRGGMGERWPVICGLLADVYAQEVVAQSGLAARCVSARIGSPIAQENNRRFADQEKAPWSEGRIGAKPASVEDSVWLHRKNTNECEDGSVQNCTLPMADSSPLTAEQQSISALVC